MEEAEEELESIAENLDDPRSVYLRVLRAHQSLCAALSFLDRTVAQGSVSEETAVDEVDALTADINALERYADLLAGDLNALTKVCGYNEPDKGERQDGLSESDVVQARDFLSDFRELPAVKRTVGSSGESLGQFSAFVEERVEESVEKTGEESVENRDDSDSEREKLLAEVERLADELDRVPSHDDVRQKGRHDLTTYYGRFGSWSDVIEASDIDHRQAFLDDVRSVGAELGEQPTLAEYEVRGKYATSRIKRAFGTWGETLDAVDFDDERESAVPDDDGPAGSGDAAEDDAEDDSTVEPLSIDVRSAGGRREKMLSIIAELRDELGRIPQPSHLPDDASFTVHDYRMEFGSWYDAVDAAEIGYREAVVEDIRRVAAELGRTPTITEITKRGRYSASDVYRLFDTWGDAKEAASDDEFADESDSGGDGERDRMLSILVDLHDELGRVPKASQLPDDAPFSRQDYLDRFDGWYDAVAATELDYRAELLQDIKDVAADLGHPPNTVEMTERGHYDSNDAYQFFDTWDEAKEAALGNVETVKEESATNSARKAIHQEKGEQMLSLVVDLHDELGRVPKASELPRDAPFTPQDYVEEFGGWYEALECTELDHRVEVLQDLEDVTEQLGRPPTTGELSEHGRYDHTDVYRHFDTWKEAKEAAGVAESDEQLTGDETDTSGGGGPDDVDAQIETDAGRELLGAVQAVARTLGRSPSLTDLTAHSQYDLNDVYDRFESWDDLKELAGVSTQASVAELINEPATTESADEPDELEVPSSELAELYETFFRLSRTVEAVVEATDRSVEGSPMAAWRDALDRFVRDGVDGWEDGYGPQQGNVSEIDIQEYRDMYGDGDHVTDFQAIKTAPLDPVVEAVLEGLELDEHLQSLRLPVVPDSGTVLPVFVESDQERERVEALLAEFPANPAVDDWEWVSEGAVRKSDEKRNADEGQADSGSAEDVATVATEALLEVSGITEPEADSLHAAGFTSVKDLREATVDEISETSGVSSQLALRIKADVGGS